MYEVRNGLSTAEKFLRNDSKHAVQNQVENDKPQTSAVSPYPNVSPYFTPESDNS